MASYDVCSHHLSGPRRRLHEPVSDAPKADLLVLQLAGRLFHSSTSQLNLEPFLSLKPPNVSHKKCSRQAGKWRSARPWSAGGGTS